MVQRINFIVLVLYVNHVRKLGYFFLFSLRFKSSSIHETTTKAATAITASPLFSKLNTGTGTYVARLIVILWTARMHEHECRCDGCLSKCWT